MTDDKPLYIPRIGDSQLRIINKRTLELSLVCTKAAYSASVDNWNFVSASVFTAPSTSSFVVAVNGTTASISNIGFKRRAYYAPLQARDLRIMSQLYVVIGSDIPEYAQVSVTNPAQNLWTASIHFTASKDPYRFSPAVHVSQIGYAPSFYKSGMVGYYLGNLQELDVSYLTTSFSLINAANQIVYTGSMTTTPDIGFEYTPIPYQSIKTAEFTNYNSTGWYRLKVEDLGVSYPFIIDDRIPMNFARTTALGFLNQKCGYAVDYPHSRHKKNACHVDLAQIPTSASTFDITWQLIANESALNGPGDMLYPFIRTGSVDVSAGHHDAGDYNKYVLNSSNFIHNLLMGVEVLNLEAYDNLQLPESGDGNSDVLSIIKWEADFLEKMQDLDGAFYILVYGKNSAYEFGESLQNGSTGSMQCVWPKNTIGTATSIAALAELASSQKFIAQYGTPKANTYLSASILGWNFLTASINQYGMLGSFQKIRGGPDDHQEALAWAASALFCATGDVQYHRKMIEWFPNPTSSATYQFGWKIPVSYYHNAAHIYAFSVMTGRRTASQLSSSIFSASVTRIIAAANMVAQDTTDSSYRAGIMAEAKSFAGGTFGWYFPSEEMYNLAIGHALTASKDYITASVGNMNYICGCNPINMCSLSGVGRRRIHNFVSLYEYNDYRTLPPNGFFQAAISPGAPYISNVYASASYNELDDMVYPPDPLNVTTSRYPFLDRFEDSWNTSNEWTMAPVATKGLVSALWIANFVSGSIM